MSDGITDAERSSERALKEVKYGDADPLDDIMVEALRKWGVGLQLDVLIEECAELTLEACRVNEALGTKSDLEAIWACAELIHRYCKDNRRKSADGKYVAVCEAGTLISSSERRAFIDELADVKVMVRQMELAFGIGDIVRHRYKEKVERLKTRMDNVGLLE